MHRIANAAALVAATLQTLPVRSIEPSSLAINSVAEVSRGKHPLAPAVADHHAMKVSLSPGGAVESVRQAAGAEEAGPSVPYMRRALLAEGQPELAAAAAKAHSHEVDLLTAVKDAKPTINDCTNRPSLVAREGNPHAAATIPDHALDPNDPCAKLSQRLTPKILHNHVITKVPDDSAKAQVPDEEVTKSKDEVYGSDEKSDKPYFMYKTCFSIFLLCVLCVLCAIGVNRYAVERKVKSIRKQREQQAAQGQPQSSGDQGQPPPQLSSAAAADESDRFSDF